MKKKQVRRKKNISTTIILMTDYGLSDPYVGAMKSVILSYAPKTQFIDLTHAVPPQGIKEAAFLLLCNYKEFPDNALFLAVVDPGVGTERDIILVETEKGFFMAPDNGLLSWMLEYNPPIKLWSIPPGASPKNDISQTFHGRDIMGPVAGRLLMKEDPEKIGRMKTSYEKIPFPAVQKSGSLWDGRILWIDHFGNLVTNIRAVEMAPLAAHSKVWIDLGAPGLTIRGLSSNYHEGEPGRLLAVVGSSGFLEISVKNGNAAKLSRRARGDKVSIHFRV